MLDQKVQLIDSCVDLLCRDYGIVPVIGIEIEFYLIRGNKPEIASARFLKNLQGSAKISLFEERGRGQYEFKVLHSRHILEILRGVKAIRSLLTDAVSQLNPKISIDYSPKPFYGDYGSGMHLHLHLDSVRYNQNVFIDDRIDTNKTLCNGVGGMLALLNQSMFLLTGNCGEEYKRYVPNFMAPINVSWGGNNRTTAIRIPDSYIANRRIEFRVASASADPYNVVLFMLLGIIYGLKYEVPAPKRIYGDASDAAYFLEKLPRTVTESKKIFELDKTAASLL